MLSTSSVKRARLADASVEMSNKIEGLRNVHTESVTAARKVAGLDNVSFSGFIVKQNLLESLKTKQIDLSARLVDAVDKVVQAQTELIDKMFEFMLEAAAIFGISEGLVKVDDLVLELAKSSDSLSREELEQYANTPVRYYLVLKEESQGNEGLV